MPTRRRTPVTVRFGRFIRGGDPPDALYRPASTKRIFYQICPHNAGRAPWIGTSLHGGITQSAVRYDHRRPGRSWPLVNFGAAGLSCLAGEQHFSPRDLTRWGLSETKIRRLFEHEPGVLRIGEPSRRVGRRLKRSYYTMRIPESIALRVYRRLTAAGRRS
jgi:hypothetical protein